MKKKKCKRTKGHILRTEDRDKKVKWNVLNQLFFQLKKGQKMQICRIKN